MVLISLGCAISWGASGFLVSLQARQRIKMERKVKLGSGEKNFVMVQFDLVGLVSIYRFGLTLGLCLLGFHLTIAGLAIKKEDALDQVKVAGREIRISVFLILN
jgi:hypothetical protein